ncbi:redoxin domain-containing protein [Patescibacteria group bacterium]|nr:redoxin domain-containing protein [Patescibacteria group bacterium]
MFAIDKKFNHFNLEAYDPHNESVVKIASSDFSGTWLILFFYPADFTFVCPTELLDLNRRFDDFKTLGVEIVAVSTDTVYTHKAWLEVEELLKGFKYRMAADHNGKFSRELGIYDEESGVAQRAAFIIDPDGVLRAVEIVADAIGRNAGEILRKLKALDFVRKNPGKVCPASWDEGGKTIEPSIKKAGRVYREYKP